MSDATLTLRRFLLARFIVGAIGTAVDLVLVGHYEDAWQVTPLFLLVVSTIVAAWSAAAGASLPIRLFQATALLLMASGAVGLWLHWQANSEFERELAPDLSGPSFVWKALRGASPPSAAPGTLIHLGLLGLAYAWRHPALVKGEQ
jgi:hypothetical protein